MLNLVSGVLKSMGDENRKRGEHFVFLGVQESLRIIKNLSALNSLPEYEMFEINKSFSTELERSVIKGEQGNFFHRLLELVIHDRGLKECQELKIDPDIFYTLVEEKIMKNIRQDVLFLRSNYFCKGMDFQVETKKNDLLLNIFPVGHYGEYFKFLYYLSFIFSKFLENDFLNLEEYSKKEGRNLRTRLTYADLDIIYLNLCRYSICFFVLINNAKSIK